jgi:hypothetical protein
VRREKPRLCSTASLERLARERERAHPSEHGERHRPDLEHDEQDRHPQVLHAQVDEVEQRVEAAHHASRRETGLGLHRVLDLGELRRHARRLLERNSVQGEEGVPRELRREESAPAASRYVARSTKVGTPQGRVIASAISSARSASALVDRLPS